MALDFPASPSIGQTYFSGNSATYTWNGTTWNVTSLPTSSVTAATASYASQVRKNITYATPVSAMGLLFIADGQVYMSKNNDGNDTVRTAALMPSGASDTYYRGIVNSYPIIFPGESGSVVSASVQGRNAFVLFDNGNLWGWGSNGAYQLGDGTTNACYMPKRINTNVVHLYEHPSNFDVDIGNGTTVIKKNDGYIWAAGYNGQNQIAPGGGNLTTFTRIDGAGQNPMFLAKLGNTDGGTIVQKDNGTIVVIGRNYKSELGVNSSTNTLTAWTTASAWQNLTGSLTMSALYAGMDYYDTVTNFNMNVLALMTSGSKKMLMAAGDNSWGNLGVGDTTARVTPVTCSLPFNHDRIVKISRRGGAPGVFHLLTDSGSLYAWGYGERGALGDGLVNLTNATPKLVAPSGTIEDMYDTAYSANVYPYLCTSPLVKKRNGCYYSFGYNNYAQAGHGVLSSTAATGSFSGSITEGLVRFPSGTNLKFAGTVCASRGAQQYRYAVTTDNRIFAWGYNEDFGIMSDSGSGVNLSVPVEVTPDVIFNQ